MNLLARGGGGEGVGAWRRGGHFFVVLCVLRMRYVGEGQGRQS